MIKTQIGITDVKVGMRVALDSRGSRGWVYHSDHRVLGIHYYTSGAIMCFTLRAWRGGPTQTVEARHVLAVFEWTKPEPKRMRNKSR